MNSSKTLKGIVRSIESSERSNEHSRSTRSSRSSKSGIDRHSDLHRCKKKVSIKVNPSRKIRDNKTDLVRDPNGPSKKNNARRRSSPEKNVEIKKSRFLKESSTGWYTVFVPNIADSDEVLQKIQTYIKPAKLYPYNKQYFDYALRFLIDDYKVAKALHNTGSKIQKDDQLIIIVLPYSPPRGAIPPAVSHEIKEKMIEAMSTRYNPSTKCLDLSRFYACPLFTDNQLFVPLNQPAVLLTALNIVAQHTKHDLYGLSLKNNHIYLGDGLIWIRRLFPDLKVLDLAGNKFSDLKELKCLSGYTIEVLNLEGNPLCDTVDKERYKSDLQQLFPTLNKLDNSELPYRYSPIETKFKMPISLGNCYPIPEGYNPQLPNPVMNLVESFLTQYYELYDNQMSRQILSEAYHENATFTLSSSLLFKNANGTISEYLPESRNFLKANRQKYEKRRYLHKGKDNITSFLDKLPKTKHDHGSFVVDVPLANDAMVQIVLNGVFAENFKETNDRHEFRSFCRTFCIVPVGSSWNIISDMFFITTVTDELLLESSKRFQIYKQKPMYNEGQSVYQGGMPKSIPQVQQMAPAATTVTQDPQQQSTVEPPSTSVDMEINQLSTGAPINVINDDDFNYIKMSMVKRFSNESGMNSKWAEQCLEENEWDYSKACTCFYYMKDKIPFEAFIYEWLL